MTTSDGVQIQINSIEQGTFPVQVKTPIQLSELYLAIINSNSELKDVVCSSIDH